MALDRIATILSWARRLAKRSDAVLAKAEDWVADLRSDSHLYVGAPTEMRCLRPGCGRPGHYPQCWDCSEEMLSRRAN